MIDAAVFTSYTAARVVADLTMPRRKHNRPYAQASGWHWARFDRCPVCEAPANTDCRPIEGDPAWLTLHKMREEAARKAGHRADRWIVCANANLVLLRDGTMYDHARKVTVR